jgi:hypothetical protein
MRKSIIPDAGPATDGGAPARVVERMHNGIDLEPGTLTRTVWLVLGLFFACLTARVLFWEVHSWADFTPDQLLTVGALVGAIASGLFVWRMLHAGRLLTALGLAVAFFGATTYCLISAAGRNDESAYARNAEARKVNDVRKRLAAEHAEAKANLKSALEGKDRDVGEARVRYETALRDEEVQCAKGTGWRCQSKRNTTKLRRADVDAAEKKLRTRIDDRRADVAAAEAKLAGQPAEQRENGKLAKVAEIIAYFSGHDEASVARGVALLWPFLPPTICEILTIAFLHLAFGHGSGRRVPLRKPPVRRETVLAGDPDGGNRRRRPETVSGPATVSGNGSATVVAGPWRKPATVSNTRMAKADCLAFIQGELARAGTIPSQETLAARAGVRKGTVSRWLKEWERDGFLTRTRAGRCNVIGA